MILKLIIAAVLIFSSATVSAEISIFPVGYDCKVTATANDSDEYNLYVGQSTSMMQEVATSAEPIFNCSDVGIVGQGQYYIAMTGVIGRDESVLSSYVIAVIGSDDEICGSFIRKKGGAVNVCVTNKWAQDGDFKVRLNQDRSRTLRITK